MAWVPAWVWGAAQSIDASCLGQSKKACRPIADLVTGWEATRQLDRRLNINKRFDKTCYNALSGTATFPSNVHGEPRQAMRTARYQF